METPQLFAQSHTAHPRCCEPQSHRIFKSLVYNAALKMSRRCVHLSNLLKQKQCINAPAVPHLTTLCVFPTHWTSHVPLFLSSPFTTPCHFCSLHLKHFSKLEWLFKIKEDFHYGNVIKGKTISSWEFQVSYSVLAMLL